jgi:hypothetical protein
MTVQHSGSAVWVDCIDWPLGRVTWIAGLLTASFWISSAHCMTI